MSRRLEASDENAKKLARKIESHTFTNEDGSEYNQSEFGGFKDYFARKRIKLQNRDAHIRSQMSSLNLPQLFRGFVMHINGYTVPNQHELSKLIVAHGGGFQQYLDGKTLITHIIASNLTPKKRVEFARYKVVKPEWIVDCIDRGKLLPWADYRLIDATPGQKRLAFGSVGDERGAANQNLSSKSSRAQFPGKVGHRQVVGSSGARNVVDQPIGTLSKSIMIPDSDDEEEIFQPYQQPTNNKIPPKVSNFNTSANNATSFTEVPSFQQQVSFMDQVEEENLPPPSHQGYSVVGDSFEDETTKSRPELGSDVGSEDAVNLVSIPLTVSKKPKGKDKHHKPIQPISNKPALQLPSSSPPDSTFKRPLPKKKRLHQALAEPIEPPALASSKYPPSKPKPVEIVDGEALWAAECIIGQRKHFNKKKPKLRRGWTQYLIRWQGFPDDEATWEFEKLLVKDVGKQGLADFVGEWQRKPHRKVGNALIFAEIPREVLEKFTKEREEFPKDYELRELDDAFAGTIPQSSQVGEVIVVRQPRADIESGNAILEKLPSIDLYREIRDSLSPQNFMSEEEEMDLLKPSILSEGDFPSNQATRETSVNCLTPGPMITGEILTERVETAEESGIRPIFEYESPIGFSSQHDEEILEATQVSRSFEYGSPVDFQELCQEEAPEVVPVLSKSFEFGTPVDFIGQFEEDSIQAELETPKPAMEDIYPPMDPMELDNKKSNLVVDHESPGSSMSQIKFLTPRDELEEYDAQIYQESLAASPSSGQLSDEHPASPQKDESEMNPEELMAAFLANPGIRAQTVLDPDFMKKYFEHSRLHHLSTWKAKIRAELQEYTQYLKPPKSRPRRYILHVDFDCFFASVSTRDRPDLAGKPIAIAHGSGSDNSKGAEIAACNYPAREFGITAGMWMSRAKELCPRLIVLGYDFPKYEEASKLFYEVIRSVGAERIHAGSVDEALLDISNLCCDVGLETGEEEENRAAEIAKMIRDRCRQNTGGLEVSVGIGGNILLAKLAMKKAKPAGQYLIRKTEVAGFMKDVVVRDLPGIGPNTARKVEEKFGTNKVGDIRKISKERLKGLLAEKTGEMMWEYCRGLDQKVVGEVTVRKSISVDVNWGVRFESQGQAEKFLMQLAKEAENRMKAENVKGKHLTLNVKQRAAHAPFKPSKHLGHGECDTTAKSILLGAATSNSEIIGKEIVTMLRAMRISPWELRGLGLTVTRLQGLQAGKADSSQQTLGFKRGPVDQELVKKKPLGEVPAREENVPPWDRPLPTAYVPRKPASLLDKYFVPKENPQLMPVPQESKSLSDTMGTQFEIPENIDVEVIPFLPTQIREKIEGPGTLQIQEQIQDGSLLEELSQESLSQPPNSQDDISVWRALPAEIRAILRLEHEQEQERIRLAREKAPLSPSKGKRQSLLPQSPRKNRPRPGSRPDSRQGTISPTRSSRTIGLSSISAPKAPGTPTKRKRGRPPATEAGPSKVVSNTNPDRILDARGNDVSGWLFDEGGIDRGYYYAVPEQDRQQIVCDAVKIREARLEETRKQQRKEALERERMANAVKLMARNRQTVLNDGIPVGTLAQIKEYLERWYEAWAEEDPRKEYAEEFEDSVAEFEVFLKKLVVEEYCIPRADEAVRFFLVLVGGEDQGQWKLVLWRFVKAVNDGLMEVGMGPIDFGFEDDFYDFL